jgi:hypothetical protein
MVNFGKFGPRPETEGLNEPGDPIAVGEIIKF